MNVVRAAINYDKVAPVPYQKTVIMVNNTLIETTQFLNKFAFLCEQKLLQVGRDIERVENTLAILEAKLSSIPELESIKADPISDAPPASAPSAPPQDSGTVADPATSGGGGAPPPPPPPGSGPPPPPGSGPPPPPPPPGSGPPPPPAAPPSASDAPPAAEPAEAPPTDGPTVQSDPRYAKYFRMVRMGVPPPVVKQKMEMEGADPNLLDFPDSPAPQGQSSAPVENDDFDDDDDDDF